MTLRHMIIFRTVYESDCNSTKAAERLHMTQPAISLAIKELEQYYGVRLFDRIGRRLKITDSGKLFLQYSIHITDLFEDMETGLRDWDSKGILRVGASITIGSQFLPGYVKAYAEICPGIDVRVVVEQSDSLEHKILTNALDFALIEGIPVDSRIVAETYMHDQLCVLCSPDKGWKQGQTITQEEFKKQRFLLREKGSGTRDVFDQVTARAGLHIVPAWEAMSTSTLINAAVTGLGIAVLPERMIQPALKSGRIITVNVENLDFRRSFYIIRQFISLCKREEGTCPGS